ncbi:hypothetical protein AB0N73_00180 [Microbacterium sp. NPDC089189]|uniref:hypothetical protein n=1 Tax=Microbacterium sp. NPDC089189 TaxID=3154972 RepID=UPI0034371FC9
MSASAPSVRFVTPRGRLAVLAAVCAIISAMGVAVVVLDPENTLTVLLGVAVVGVFGLGGGASIVGQLRQSVILRADDEGIRIARIGSAPWADVDRIGTTPRGELGIRMRRTDALLANPRTRTTRESLRETRATSGGYDLTFTERELGTAPAEAARALRSLSS